METNINNASCLDKSMSLYSKEHLSNIRGSFHEKVKATLKLSLKKSIAFKKNVYKGTE